jgi:hypothetical protein
MAKSSQLQHKTAQYAYGIFIKEHTHLYSPNVRLPHGVSSHCRFRKMDGILKQIMG